MKKLPLTKKQRIEFKKKELNLLNKLSRLIKNKQKQKK